MTCQRPGGAWLGHAEVPPLHSMCSQRPKKPRQRPLPGSACPGLGIRCRKKNRTQSSCLGLALARCIQPGQPIPLELTLLVPFKTAFASRVPAESRRNPVLSRRGCRGLSRSELDAEEPDAVGPARLRIHRHIIEAASILGRSEGIDHLQRVSAADSLRDHAIHSELDAQNPSRRVRLEPGDFRNLRVGQGWWIPAGRSLGRGGGGSRRRALTQTRRA